MNPLKNVKALTFDLFGTILDLEGSLTPYIAKFIKSKGASISPSLFWQQYRARQRIEQYQDTILMLGHSGYLETARRAFVYVSALNDILTSQEEVRTFMASWQELSPFPEVIPALKKLKNRYQLVALSNGEPSYLDHLVKNRLHWDFEKIFSVDVVGAFKPHPGVYRRAASLIGLETNQCLMVSANSFDVMGARSCGYRGAYINRYRLPYEDTLYQPDLTVQNFTELAEALTESKLDK
jgi:2-haloacid dehalogenase